LKHGTFTAGTNGDRFQRTIQIRCEMAQAKRLLDLATKLCLKAASDIEKAIGIEGGS
jgi:hypothetical protein